MDEIPLLREADDIVVTVDDTPVIADSDPVWVAITTVQSTSGGAGFSLSDLPVGHVADWTGDTVAEDQLPGPSLLAGIDCGGPVPGVSMYASVAIAVLLLIGVLVSAVLLSRRFTR